MSARILVVDDIEEQQRRETTAAEQVFLEQRDVGEVTAEQLKPESRWARVRDKSWPNPKGRPTHDVVTA